MRTIIYLIQKELIQLKRNRMMLPILFILPIVQLLVLLNAATFEIKNTRITFIDNDLSSTSRQLTAKIAASPFFIVKPTLQNQPNADESLKSSITDAVIVIPQGFEKKLVRENKTDIQLLINGAAVSSAAVVNGYLTAIIQEFNKDALRFAGKKLSNSYNFSVIPSFWFNPTLKYSIFMLPGILVILVSAIGLFMSSMMIVREKELGTIEQLNVTPIKKYEFILGKMVPFWLIGIFLFTVGLLAGKLLFNLPMLGSMATLYLILAVYMLVALGIGLFLSTFADTQQQVMFVAWFIMIVFILMSGFFTPAESMPVWAQRFNVINPFAYFIRVNRMILLKGSGLIDVARELISLSIFAFSIISLAVWRYKKTN